MKIFAVIIVVFLIACVIYLLISRGRLRGELHEATAALQDFGCFKLEGGQWACYRARGDVLDAKVTVNSIPQLDEVGL